MCNYGVPKADRIAPLRLAAEQPFVKGLRRAIKRAIIVRMMILARWELVCHAVDRRGRSRDHLFDFVLDAKLQEVKGRPHHYVHGCSGFRRTLRYAQRRLVKKDIRSLDQLGHQ